MAESISFTGLGSGIDLASIVDALVKAERLRYIEPFEEWQTEWENKIDAFQTLNTKLSSLHSTVKGLDRESEFLTKTASSSDDDVLTATAASSAINGSYRITVGSSIKHRLASDGKADSDTTDFAVVGDQLQLTVGSNTETITLNGGDYTLDGIASEINTESALVSAEVIDDGSSSNNYRIVLTAGAGGNSNTIIVDSNDTSVDFSMSAAGDRIDAAEGSLTGTASVSSGGHYLGTTNKTFQFTISGSGTYSLGSDSFSVDWSDGEGNTGTVSVSGSEFADLEVFQGVEISFAGNLDTLEGGDTFTVDVWNPDLQSPQDDGLAKVEKEIHAGFSDTGTTAVTSSDQSFSYTYNGQIRQLDVAGGTTLSELADLINSDSENPGVSASIINDGTGLSTAYHLVLTGQSTGKAYKIENISHSLDNADFSGSFTESQSAQNAMVKVDGYPSGDEYLQRDTNTVSDVVAGVELSLNGTGSATVTVNSDTSSIKQNIYNFVDAFNDVRSYVQEKTAYDTENNEAGILLGNYAVDNIKNRLNAIVASPPSGFRDGYDEYTLLSQIGVYTDAESGSETEGQLIVDDVVLSEALSDDADAVADLFAAYFEGRAADSNVSYKSHIDGITDAGTYEVQFNHLNPSESKMRLKGTSTWHDASWDVATSTLTGLAGYPESGLVVVVNNVAQSYTAEVDLKRGIAGDLKDELDSLTDPDDGPLAVLEENYQDIVDNIQDKIDREEDRIDLLEQRLIQRYARLEQTLSELNSQSQYMEMRLNQISG